MPTGITSIPARTPHYPNFINSEVINAVDRKDHHDKHFQKSVDQAVSKKPCCQGERRKIKGRKIRGKING